MSPNLEGGEAVSPAAAAAFLRRSGAAITEMVWRFRLALSNPC